MTRESSRSLWTGTVREYLRLAREGQVPEGWSHLPRGRLELDSPCVVIPSELDVDEHEAEAEALALARAHGCERKGLDAQLTEDTAACARQLRDPPDDALLLESFHYYLEHDAFLPAPGAPPPRRLSLEALQREADRSFYEGLGAEVPDSPCREPGCGRGSLRASVFCRVHHFEMVTGRPCPFGD